MLSFLPATGISSSCDGNGPKPAAPAPDPAGLFFFVSEKKKKDTSCPAGRPRWSPAIVSPGGAAGCACPVTNAAELCAGFRNNGS